MKKSWKRVEVTIETETLVLSPADVLRACWCESCNDHQLMLDPVAAARLASVATEVVYAGIAAGAVHFIELPGSVVLVCSNSVALYQSENESS